MKADVTLTERSTTATSVNTASTLAETFVNQHYHRTAIASREGSTEWLLVYHFIGLDPQLSNVIIYWLADFHVRYDVIKRGADVAEPNGMFARDSSVCIRNESTCVGQSTERCKENRRTWVHLTICTLHATYVFRCRTSV